MVMNEKKQHEVFVEMVNKQLSPYNKTYEDVIEEGDGWYSRYTTTSEKEKEFSDWCVDLLRKKLKMTKRDANKYVSYFILCYGLRVEDN